MAALYDLRTMPQFAANLSMMYTEVTFLDRFAAAAGDQCLHLTGTMNIM